MGKVLILLLLSLVQFAFPAVAKAEETLLYDSTDHYLGACSLTDTAKWELEEDLAVSKFQVWYNWSTGETELPVELTYNGQEFASFTVKRSSCDPYQQSWCNGDFEILKTFQSGEYEAKIPNKKMCLKPGGTGTIRLYGQTGAVSTSTPTPTDYPILTPTPTREVVYKEGSNESCSCTKTIIATSVAASFVSSLVFYLVFRKK